MHIYMCAYTRRSQGVDSSEHLLVLPGQPPQCLRGTVILNSSHVMLKGVPIRGPCSCGRRIGQMIQAHLIPYW